MSNFLFKFRPILNVAHFLVSSQNQLTRTFVIRGFLDSKSSSTLERIGTPYGGWWAPVLPTGIHKRKFLLSAGLGFDTSFDLGMAERGFFIAGLDPLSECCDAASKSLDQYHDVRIINKGISVFDGSQEFFEPKNPNHDSWSTINAQEVKGSTVRLFEVISIETLFSEIQEFQNADYRFLKMDIEGAELEILEKALSKLTLFDFIGVEMDFLSLIPFMHIKKRVTRVIKARRILKSLSDCGYDLIKVDNFNFFWSKH